MSDELKERIREYLKQARGKTARPSEVMKKLGIPATERATVRRLFRELEAEGQVAKLRGQRFIDESSTFVVEGILRQARRGFGFVTPESSPGKGKEGSGSTENRDIFVSRKGMADALDGDRVRVRVLPPARFRKSEPGMLREGRVIEVLERGRKQIPGSYFSGRKGGTVVPTDAAIGRTITVARPPGKLGVKDGSYVMVEITAWTNLTEPLIGRVVELIGNPGDPGIDLTLIIRDAGVDPDFPPDVLAEAERVPVVIPDEELARRTDFRSIRTFTMDGAGAQDFDDALSIEKTPDGMYRLGVHIADVSWYVRQGTALDGEAVDRATSIYPLDRVIPMLPEKLSHGVCSLRPNEDRLVMSCVMEIDSRGRVHHYSVHEGVIRSAHRLIYEEVQAVMDGQAEPGKVRELGDIRIPLELLYELKTILTAMRMRRGALDLDMPETEIQFDEHHQVAGIRNRLRLDAHRVVEECMLIANEVVATHLFNLHVPSVYRIHEPPDLEKLQTLQPVLAHLGVKFPAKKGKAGASIQEALDQSKKEEWGAIARRLILRSLMRAKYSDKNLGHYGLASTCYTHFTSPIRRYPDLLVHRILRETMQAGAASSGVYRPPAFASEGIAPEEDAGSGKPVLGRERTTWWRENLPELTRHSSEREQRAQEIEDNATRTLAVEYMSRFIGQEFKGMVTGVASFGFFVELDEIPVEGLVHLNNLQDDYYEYDPARMSLTGRESGRVIRLADRLTIQVSAADVSTRDLDFMPVEFDKWKNGSGQSEQEKRRVEKRTRREGRKPAGGGFQKRGGGGGRRKKR